ncbi:hypothetical protein DIPPA_19617 [Diplonema papillatum]|nr:hypothetical protein DIPPA_19617 [Diplonema papillatum]
MLTAPTSDSRWPYRLLPRVPTTVYRSPARMISDPGLYPRAAAPAREKVTSAPSISGYQYEDWSPAAPFSRG